MSVEDVIVFIPLATLISLCLVIFIAMMFQWMVKKLICLALDGFVWMLCLPPRAMYRRARMRGETVEV